MDKTISLYKSFYFGTVALCIAAIVLLVGKGSDNVLNVSNLFLLPTVYLISLLLTKDLIIHRMGLAICIIEITLFCRYVGSPLLFAYDVEFTGTTVSNPQFHSAIILMCYELICVSLAMRIWYNRNKSDFFNEESNFTVHRTDLNIVTVLLVLFWLYIVATTPQLHGNLVNYEVISRAELGLDTSITIGEYMEGISGVFTTFFKIGITLVFVLALCYSSKFKMPKYIRVIILLVLCFLFISSMWSNGFSVSRWGMMQGVLMSAYALIELYPNQQRSIIRGSIVAVLFVVIVGSLLKTISFGQTDNTLKDSTDMYFSSTQFDEYFSGVNSVANGIGVVSRHGEATGAEDILINNFYNVPFLMKALGLHGKANATDLYHNTTGRTDTIIPCITMGYLHFGLLFSPIYSIIVIILALSLNHKISIAESLYEKLLLVEIVFWASLSMVCLNTNILDAHIWSAMLGLLIIYLSKRYLKIII